MTFVEALKPYRDAWGLVHDKLSMPDYISQNGICFTAEAALIAQARGELSEPLREELLEAVNACWDPREGLLYRHPSSHRVGNQESIDDFAGLACLARILGAPKLAASVIRAGREKEWTPKIEFSLLSMDVAIEIEAPRYYYPDEAQYRERFSARAWLGRFPALIASLEWAGAQEPSWPRRQIWALSARFGSVKTHDQARIARLLAHARGDLYWIDLVEARVRAQHGSLQALYTNYFGTTLHPFVQYAFGLG